MESFAKLILESDTNSTRFERFCVDVIGADEGLTVLPTSTKWDRGRDGRTTSKSDGSHALIVCASLADDVDEKASLDIERVGVTATPDRLIFCSSQPLTEHRIDQLRLTLTEKLPPNCHIAILGSIQLAVLAAKHVAVFQATYQGELSQLQATLRELEQPQRQETRGLVLALATFDNVDARELRSAILRNAILQILGRESPQSPASIAVRLSADLRLPKTLDRQLLDGTNRGLEAEGLVAGDAKGRLELTSAGKKAAADLPSAAAKNLLSGHKILSKRLNELTGVTLAESQKKAICSTIADFLTDAFYSNGMAVIRAIEAHLSGNDLEPNTSAPLRELLKKAAARIKQLTDNPELGDDLEQAVIDMFTERQGPAFEWLTFVCERFVAICSLGLEASSSEEVRSLLRRYRIVLDSDIILTLLCHSEADHDAARQLVTRWRRLGGRLMVAAPVLAEVANHAWISERDFQETKLLLGKLRGQDLRRYAQNAFVRAFHLLAETPSDARKWSSFIDDFRGERPEDYRPLVEILRSDFAVEMLPATTNVELEHVIRDFLTRIIAQRYGIRADLLEKKWVDKAERDAKLLTDIASSRDALRRAGSADTVLLLSSSPRLRAADERFRTALGAPKAVISFAAFAYLLSLVPDAGLGADALRRALFEFGESAYLPDTQRLAMRVIKASGTYDVPWSKRPSLSRKLEAVLHREADRLGKKRIEIEERFAAGDDMVRPAALITAAVKELAISDATELELRTMSERMAALQEQYESLLNEFRKRR